MAIRVKVQRRPRTRICLSAYVKIGPAADDTRGRPPYRRGSSTTRRRFAMKNRSDRTLDRVGAAAGIAAVLLLVSLFTMLPALPSPEKPISEIARSATAN